MLKILKKVIGWILYGFGALVLVSDVAALICMLFGLYGNIELLEKFMIAIIMILYGLIAYGIFYLGKKLIQEPKEKSTLVSETLDDITYIKQIKVSAFDPWQQYDVLLAARGYGWEDMKSWAEYMAKNDLKNVSSITSGTMGQKEKELIKEYDGTSIMNIPSLANEQGILTIAGDSQAIRNKVKIVWFNQCNYFRIFSLCKDEELMKRYIETVIRRSFHTADAMKLAKPLPEEVKKETKAYVHDFGKVEVSEQVKAAIKVCSYHYLVNQKTEWCDYNIFVDLLSGIMDVSAIKLNVQFTDDEDQAKAHILASADSVALLEQYIQSQKKEELIAHVQKASLEDLMKAWSALDYCVWLIKGNTQLTVNIQAYRDYILSNIVARREEFLKEEIVPVRVQDANVYLQVSDFFMWKFLHLDVSEFEYKGVIALTEKQPTIHLYENEELVQDYVLQVQKNEDFSGKYFLMSVRLHLGNRVNIAVCQIDGFVADTNEDVKFTIEHVGYRFEGYLLKAGGHLAKKAYDEQRGKDLYAKGLRYPGYITSSNVRLLGVCPACGKSFVFHGYNYPHAQCEPAYSEDGLDTYEIADPTIDKETWSVEKDGKIFKFYNSFNCPHCKESYIDYKKYPDMKVFGVLGCVHLGKEAYRD